MYTFHEQKNQHLTSFMKKKQKYNKFLEDINQDVLSFLRNNPHGTNFLNKIQPASCFTKKKGTCNKFHEEKYYDKSSFMKE